MQTYGKDLEQEARWKDEKKYFAARSAWRKRHRKVVGKGYTWAYWFELRFGEKLSAYAERMKKAK